MSDMVHAGIVSGNGDDYQKIKMILFIDFGYLIDTCELFYKGFRK